jgi:hypothetical protein
MLKAPLPLGAGSSGVKGTSPDVCFKTTDATGPTPGGGE